MSPRGGDGLGSVCGREGEGGDFGELIDGDASGVGMVHKKVVEFRPDLDGGVMNGEQRE